jgi:hypothetical protein
LSKSKPILPDKKKLPSDRSSAKTSPKQSRKAEEENSKAERDFKDRIEKLSKDGTLDASKFQDLQQLQIDFAMRQQNTAKRFKVEKDRFNENGILESGTRVAKLTKRFPRFGIITNCLPFSYRPFRLSWWVSS